MKHIFVAGRMIKILYFLGENIAKCFLTAKEEWWQQIDEAALNFLIIYIYEKHCLSHAKKCP